MLVIINYEVGNLTSVLNMFRILGNSEEVFISNDPKDIVTASKLVLPGVGHFDYGMNQLKKSGLIDILNERVIDEKIPILGICLGAQLLTKGSEEGSEPGLGWINAQTIKFDLSQIGDNLKVPHMGWNEVKLMKKSKLFEDIPEDPRFYFVHSYHIHCNEPSDIMLSTEYGYEITAAIENENILGVQFHPEKSHKFGLQLLSNFIKNY